MVWIHCWVPPYGRTWQRSAHWKRAPPRVVFSSLYKFPRDHCPWLLSREARKEGCDSPVLARLILLLRSLVSCVGVSPALRRRRPRSAKHPGRPRRAERRTEFVVDLGMLARVD